MKPPRPALLRKSWAATCAVLLPVIHGAQAPDAAYDVEDRGSTVTIVRRGEASWKAVVDRAHGGMISELHLPAEAPNVIAADDGHSRGLFNLFYMTRVKEGATEDDRIKAKGTLWSGSTEREVRVARHTADEVVVEARGKAKGWRLLGPPDETVVAYRQTYTFRPDHIECAGELTWLYGHHTRLEYGAASRLGRSIRFRRPGVRNHWPAG